MGDIKTVKFVQYRKAREECRLKRVHETNNYSIITGL